MLFAETIIELKNLRAHDFDIICFFYLFSGRSVVQTPLQYRLSRPSRNVTFVPQSTKKATLQGGLAVHYHLTAT
jgi:hypothetical protein